MRFIQQISANSKDFLQCMWGKGLGEVGGGWRWGWGKGEGGGGCSVIVQSWQGSGKIIMKSWISARKLQPPTRHFQLWYWILIRAKSRKNRWPAGPPHGSEHWVQLPARWKKSQKMPIFRVCSRVERFWEEKKNKLLEDPNSKISCCLLTGRRVSENLNCYLKISFKENVF